MKRHAHIERNYKAATERFHKNKNLAFYAVNRFFPLLPWQDREDAISIANYGLWKACLAFRPEIGYAFSTYAMAAIRSQFIQNGVWRNKLRRHGSDYTAPDAPRLVSLSARVANADDDIEVGNSIADPNSDPVAILIRREELDEAREHYDNLFPSIKARCRGWGEELAALYGEDPPPVDKRTKIAQAQPCAA